MNEKKCARCGERAETIDNIRGTTFWGLIQRTTATRVRKQLRVACTQYTRTEKDERVITVDETRPLCDPCWGLLVGRFLQGRDVVAAEHEHEWRRGRDDLEQCSLCYQTRIAVEKGDTADG
ncbi:hypothetical protein [Microbacterium sp. NPDC089696]|uniref:hypothetical protein n=1 Tax=Microbacterium sp. NPDC089696 TaxID=3364199 RepID=UPI0038296646